MNAGSAKANGSSRSIRRTRRRGSIPTGPYPPPRRAGARGPSAWVWRNRWASVPYIAARFFRGEHLRGRARLHTRRRLRQITWSACRVTTDRSWLTSRRLKRESRWTLDRKSPELLLPATSTPETARRAADVGGVRNARANSTRWSSPAESRPRDLSSRWATPAARGSPGRPPVCGGRREEDGAPLGGECEEVEHRDRRVGSRGRRCGTYPMRGAPCPCSAARQKRISPVYATCPDREEQGGLSGAVGPTRAVTSPHRRSASIPKGSPPLPSGRSGCGSRACGDVRTRSSGRQRLL